ncbi:hypothetical protein BDZ94DRAFT_1266819 [Collybia nuda]|uniref:Uncharacterized protein n=1 Tax=Collybia nuda TaxID=64659 RepID=A0A9P6CBZ5_9AGAR|nr:hypothetical protein BDZ94DRAFT_1266819 [Collybia nuda]
MAKLCLGYSVNDNQSCMLSILLHVNENHTRDWKPPNNLQTPTFLIPHAHRIRRLSILSPLSLRSLILPQLKDLEILVPGFEAHPQMDIPTLLQRSGNILTRLSVGYILDCRTLLEYTPYIRKLVIEGTLTEEVMKEIANGRLGAALREIKCTVALYDCDVFLDMIEARAPTSMEGNEVGSVRAITKVGIQCVDFSLDARQWARIGSLATGVQFDIVEG